MANFKIGIELECVFDSDKLDLHNYGHRRSTEGMNKQIKGWAVTHDGSLRTTGSKFVNPATAEIVSRIADSTEVELIVNNLKEFCWKADKGKELREFFEFNKSCGCHIHFSTDGTKENNMLSTKLYKEMRQRTFERVKQELPRLYSSFKDHYFRPQYATPQNGELIDKKLRGEICYTNLQKGIEWRAFHTKGVETWEELVRLLRIGVEEINNLLDEYERNNFAEEFSFEISDEELGYYTQQIEEIMRD